MTYLLSGLAADIAAAPQNQTATLAVVTSKFTGDVTVRLYSATNVHLSTLTYAGFAVSGTTTKRIMPSNRLARTFVAAGVVARAVFLSGTTEIFEINNLEPTPLDAESPVSAGPAERLELFLDADSNLPVGTDFENAVTAFEGVASIVLGGPAYAGGQTLTLSSANRLADIPADFFGPQTAVWRVPTSDAALFAAVMYQPVAHDGTPWACAGMLYERVNIGSLGVAITPKQWGAPKEYDFAFTHASGQTLSYQSRVSPTGGQARSHKELMCSYVPSRDLPWRANWRTFFQKSGVNNILAPSALQPNPVAVSSPITNLTATRFQAKYMYNDQGTAGERQELGMLNEPLAWLIAHNGVDGPTAAGGLSYLQWASGIAKDIAEFPAMTCNDSGQLRAVDVVNQAAHDDLVCVMATGSPANESRGFFIGDREYQFIASTADMQRVDAQHNPAGLGEYALMTGNQWYRWQHQRKTYAYAANNYAARKHNAKRYTISDNAGRGSAWSVKEMALMTMLAPAADNGCLWSKTKTDVVVNTNIDYAISVQGQAFNAQKAPFYGTVEQADTPATRDRSMLGRSYWAVVGAWLMNCTDATLRAKAATLTQAMFEGWLLRPANVDFAANQAAAAYFKNSGGTAYGDGDWAASFSDYITNLSAPNQTAWGSPYAGLTAQMPTWDIPEGSYYYAHSIRGACAMLGNVTGPSTWTAGATYPAFAGHLNAEQTRLAGGEYSRFVFGDGSQLV